MSRKVIAEETLRIQRQGFYEYNGTRVEFATEQKHSEENSELITPEQGKVLVKGTAGLLRLPQTAACSVANESTVKAILDFAEAKKERIGVLNFASAKNPGGGFLNGAMAQEESLAASSGLYETQLRNESYYKANRACGTMMYTDYAIYSPDVVFFRNQQFGLLERPVTASVLTLPAVNFGQVLLKGEDPLEAERLMKDRMRLALAIFAQKGDKNLILGAYGCGVFRNDPVKVARWWRELLVDEGLGFLFSVIRFAVLDNSKESKCLFAFEKELNI
ncbi:TIGR02452 family protein [Paenibacillus planticolens]|uniref:TIGR02452 family protein n=1 Tax=Paenibacillus planticolens TaxID=2654976 RepID=A0ABX1ZNY4_9BACL|nr:TIGR02452 family protein [Paenibacillus planticolens]NOV00592.1 TIGR02452 family protein [Paenibacillus planticolens]